jgi:VCBS repeat-containing protein
MHFKRDLCFILLALILAIPAFADDVTVSGNVNFSSLDGSSLDHDGAANGTFTVDDGNLTVQGTINCNDAGAGANSACPMRFVVSGNMTVAAGGALYAENRSGGGDGGAITITTGGALVLAGTAPGFAGAIVSSGSTDSTGAGGAITLNAGGASTFNAGSVISAASKGGNSGAITVNGSGAVTANGLIASGPSRTLTGSKTSGQYFSGGSSNQKGGAITIKSSTTSEPNVFIGGDVVSQGETPGAGLVLVDACGVEIRGLLASIGKDGGSNGVTVRSGTSLLVDGRDLAGVGSRRGLIRVDATNGDASSYNASILGRTSVQILGPATGSVAVVNANPGGNNDGGGTITVMSTEGTAIVSGNAARAGDTANGDNGGSINISSKGNVTLDTAALRAIGGKNGKGGAINVRSHSGSVSWQNGTGDARPTGSAISAPNRGTITITYCTTVTTAGSNFPVDGSTTGTYPTLVQTCSPAAPTLPAGQVLPTCNRPPIVNNDAYTVAEGGALNVPPPGVLANDVEPDGQPMTASLVTGPANGSLTFNADGSFIYVHNGGETTSDSFTYTASDGTLTSSVATVSITITPVNDPPVANNDAYAVAEGGTLNLAAPGVKSNDTDPDNSNASLVVQLVSGPTNGTLVLNPDGSFVYTHNGTETTSDSFTYQLSDGVATSNVATVSITVTAVNDPPVANNDAYTVAEGGTLNVAAPGVLGNDTDNEGSTLTSSVVTGPANGTLTLNANGSFTYVHNGGETTSDSFTYTANDGSANSNVATVNITVTPVNDAPVANPDSYTVAEGGTLIVPAPGVLGNDTDAEGQPLTAIVGTGAGNGTVTLNADGSFTYVHNGGESTSDSFTYQASDGSLLSNVTTVNITITPVNDAPVANDDAYTVAEGGTLSIAAPGVIANDTDAENQALTAQLVTTTANGTLTFNADGSFTYVHNGGETTSDSFTYRVSDGSLQSNIATVTIAVTAVNDAPIANNDSYAVNEGGTLTIAAPGVLGNDTDAENNTLSAVLVSGPANGSLTLNANGSFTYIHNGSETTSDSFTYMANDGTANSNVATVTITITPVNDAPVANNDAYSVNEGGTLNVAAPGVLGNDTDAENQALSATLVSTTTNGTLTLNADGSFTYIHNGGESTSDSFTYTATDGAATSNVATVTITINAVNDAPVANNDAYSVAEGGTLNVAAPGVIGNDTDPDGPSLTATLVSGTTNGSLTLNADGSFTYVHNGSETTSDSFTYTISDGTATSNVATVTITVTPVNDAPVANNDAYSVNEGGTLTVATPGVLGNDTDAENNPLSAQLVTGPANGLLTLQPDGSFTYVHNGSETTTDSFTYRANDGTSLSNIATVTITIAPVNDAPVANNDAYSVNANATLNVPAPGVLGNDTDAEGQSLTATLVTTTTKGTLTLNADGSFTYVHGGLLFGTDTFTYTASDGAATSNVATVTITIINQAPTAGADSFAGVGNTELRVGTGAALYPHAAVAGSVLANDNDPEGSTLVVTTTTTTSTGGGSVTMTPTGNFTYLPAVGFTGTDTFTYTITDGFNTTNGTVTINVANRIWYVKNTAIAGDGRSPSPFSTLSAAQSASAAGDTIFVHTGVGPTGPSGIILKPSQRLQGEGVALVSGPYTLWPAGARPTLTNSSGIGVSLASNNIVTGLNVSAFGIGISGGSGSSANISEVNVTGGTVGVSIASATGAFTFTNVRLQPGQTGLAISGGSPAITATNLDIITSGFNGISAVSTGSLTIGTGSTVTTTGSGAVAITGMTRNVSLESVSASGSSSSIGIFLSGGSGTFAVTGVGTTAGSGGTITGMNRGVRATDAATVSLKNMNINNSVIQGVLFETAGPNNGTIEVRNSSLTGNVSNAIQTASSGSGLHTVTIDATTFTTNNAALATQTTSNGPLTVTVTNSTATFSTFSPFNVTRNATANATVKATFTGNTVGTLGVANSGCSTACFGINLNGQGVGAYNALVSNNTIQRVDTFGINASIGAGNGQGSFTITNNILRDPSAGALSAIWSEVGILSTDAASNCSTITGNVITGAWDPSFQIVVSNNLPGNTFRVPGYVGAPGNTAAVEAFISANNGGAAAFANDGGSGFVGGAACTLP